MAIVKWQFKWSQTNWTWKRIVFRRFRYSPKKKSPKKIVPRVLNDDQKEHYMQGCQEIKCLQTEPDFIESSLVMKHKILSVTGKANTRKVSGSLQNYQCRIKQDSHIEHVLQCERHHLQHVLATELAYKSTSL